MRYAYCTIANNSSELFLVTHNALIFILQYYFHHKTNILRFYPGLSCAQLLSKHNSAGEQDDEFNIRLHNSALPSCLQLKRIFFDGFYSFP